MEEAKRIVSIHKEKLEHVPELLHGIQLLLPPEEAARTCVLSKSWLHAYSTIPELRFYQTTVASEEQRIDHLKVVERTLLRYIRDDIPFEKTHLSIDIANHELASFAEKWIRLTTTKSCLNELCLSMGYGIIGSFTMPDEIFSSNKLYKMSISGCCKTNKRWLKGRPKPEEHCILVNSNPVINCVALRVLELRDVTISEDVLEKLLSTCILLEKIELIDCKGFKNIKVRNLRYLYELRINLCGHDQSLEIYDVPNIRFFSYCVCFQRNPPTLLNLDSLRCVTDLSLDGLVDDSFYDMLKSKFQYLESLRLAYQFGNSKCLDITCPRLKRLIVGGSLTRITVNAPKLHIFRYEGNIMPNLVFPAIAPAQIKLNLDIENSDDLFFLNIAEALLLSSEFDISITTRRFDLVEPSNIVMDDLRTRFTTPATNVQHLWVQTYSDNGLWEWEHSSFFDVFFYICHPKHVVAHRDLQYKNNNYFCKLMLKEVMEKNTRNGFWPDYLKEVEIKTKDSNGGNWETLTNAGKICLKGSSLFSSIVKFKLNWF